MMERPCYLARIQQGFATSQVVAILGPRQCGKTTLARAYFATENLDANHYFDLENPTDLTRLQDPLLAMSDLKGLVVIDEVQRIPELFTTLRVLVDGDKSRRYLILGSASRELIKQSAETLAGRIHYIELTPFTAHEIADHNTLWVRGGFPLSYLATNDFNSVQWRKDYIKTFLEQDIPNLGINIPATNLRRFWMMLAHYHGQIFNASEMGNSLDYSHHTIQKYLDILTGTFMIRQLAPWYENIGKRQVKSKKIYFRDSGIYHALLNISDYAALTNNPKLGASWEGFALESVIRKIGADPNDCYFWATHAHAELDLLVMDGLDRTGYEFKYSTSPKLTKSMQIAVEDLNLRQLIVIYPGDKKIHWTKQITGVGFEDFISI